MTEVYDHLVDDWRAWTGILNEAQARQLVDTFARRAFQQQESERTDMAKSIYNVTAPATIQGVVEATDEKDAAQKFRDLVKAIFGQSLGVISIVGDPKVSVVAAGKASSSKKDEEEDEEDEEEDEEDEEEDEEEEDEEEEDEEEEDEEEEEEKPTKKKADKKSDGGKKMKIKLKGK